MKFRKIYILLIMLISGCIERVEPLLDYEIIDRQVGPEGGIISFYEGGLPGESGSYGVNTKPLATLNIPEGALNDTVNFIMRQRLMSLGENIIDIWEVLPNDLEFNKPVSLTMTYGLEQEEYNSLKDRCFYKPYSLPLDADFTKGLTNKSYWKQVSEYTLNPDELTFTVTVNDLKSVYFFALAEFEADYVFCEQTNEPIDVSFGGDHNVLIIPPGAVPLGTQMNEEIIELPEKTDYPQPTIEDYVILSSTGGYGNLTANNTSLSKPALLFYHLETEQAGEVWLDWNSANEKIKFLRINPETMSILEVLDYSAELSDINNHLFAAEITTLGAYVLAVPKTDFLLRFGGSIHVKLSGGTIYDKVIEHYDYGGAFVDLFDSRYELNINAGKDQTAGFFYMLVAFGDDFEDREYPQYSNDYMIFKYYDENDIERWVRLKSFGGNISYTLVDQEEGWVEGSLISKTAQSAYNESGQDVQLEIIFKFRIAKWFEL